jgi:hypothetical protein
VGHIRYKLTIGSDHDCVKGEGFIPSHRETLKVKTRLFLVVCSILVGAVLGGTFVLVVGIVLGPFFYHMIGSALWTPPRPVFSQAYLWSRMRGYEWSWPMQISDKIGDDYMVDVPLNVVLVLRPRPMAPDRYDSSWFQVRTTEWHIQIEESVEDGFPHDRIIRFAPEKNTAYIVFPNLTVTKAHLRAGAAEVLMKDAQQFRRKPIQDIIAFLKDLTVPNDGKPPQADTKTSVPTHKDPTTGPVQPGLTTKKEGQ